jgi:hypothetical protein
MGRDAGTHGSGAENSDSVDALHELSLDKNLNHRGHRKSTEHRQFPIANQKKPQAPAFNRRLEINNRQSVPYGSLSMAQSLFPVCKTTMLEKQRRRWPFPAPDAGEERPRSITGNS